MVCNASGGKTRQQKVSSGSRYTNVGMTGQPVRGVTTIAEEYPLAYDRRASVGNDPYYPIPKAKNDAAIRKTEASDQWNFYQAKNSRLAIAEVALDLVPDLILQAEYALTIAEHAFERLEGILGGPILLPPPEKPARLPPSEVQNKGGKP